MEGYFDYMKLLLAPQELRVFIGMHNPNTDETGAFPVTVYNVNNVSLGTAANKQEYMDLWNADADNQEIGQLVGFYGPFEFILVTKNILTVPAYVIGDDGGVAVNNYLIDGLDYILDDGEYING